MKKMLMIFGGAVGIYLVIVLLIAVIPAIDLSHTPPGPGVEPLTPLQAEGREVYAGNGCGYCHTQQVRPIAADEEFGRPSAPGDFTYQTPELLGSERTGPDLADVGNRKPSDVWQYMHLYDPRAVVPESIMPDFRFLFRVVDEVPEGETAVVLPDGFGPAHGKVIPTHKAKALVAYLLSLKQTKIPGYEMHGGMGGPKSAAPAPGKKVAAAVTGEYHYEAATGKKLFEAHCAACHQANGEGVPGAFPPLKGNAAVDDADPTLHIDTILHGVHGKTIDGTRYSGAMPPFSGQLDDTDIANIANYERSSWGNDAEHVTPDEVAAVRKGGTADTEPANAGTTAPATAASAKPAAAASSRPASAKADAGKKVTGDYHYDASKGKNLFVSKCSACHQASGKGIPGAFPSLRGNSAVTDSDPSLHIDTVLHGAHGKTIDGKTYSSAMPPFAGQLSDREIADIINYERSSWGNHADKTSAADVARARAADKQAGD